MSDRHSARSVTTGGHFGAGIITLTKHTPELPTPGQAGEGDLTWLVARMIGEWEGSDELATELAARIVAVVAASHQASALPR